MKVYKMEVIYKAISLKNLTKLNIFRMKTWKDLINKRFVQL